MSSAIRPAARLFSTTTQAAAEGGRGLGRASGRGNARAPAKASRRPILQPFEFNDTTTSGYLRLAKMRQMLELVEKVEGDHAVLKGLFVH